jgi:DNA invertase Pin-like site-specific DNA recombinase
MLIGCAHVSTPEQNLDLQKDALTQAGCGRIFADTRSGAHAEFERGVIRERTQAGLQAAGATAAAATSCRRKAGTWP